MVQNDARAEVVKPRRTMYTIRRQLIPFSLAIIVIPYCVTGTVVYKGYVDSVRTEAEQYILQYGEQIAGSLSAYLDQMYRTEPTLLRRRGIRFCE